MGAFCGGAGERASRDGGICRWLRWGRITPHLLLEHRPTPPRRGGSSIDTSIIACALCNVKNIILMRLRQHLPRRSCRAPSEHRPAAIWPLRALELA